MYEISPQEHIIMDCIQMADTIIPTEYLLDSYFELDKWYSQQREQAIEEMSDGSDCSCDMPRLLLKKGGKRDERVDNTKSYAIRLNGQQIPADRLPAVQRNASHRKDFTRSIPKLIVIVTSVNGHPLSGRYQLVSRLYVYNSG
jgi:hypothetical protein